MRNQIPIMNVYQEIYCGIYRLCFRKVDIGNYSATILLSTLLSSNLIAFIGVLQLIGLVEPTFPSRSSAMIMASIILGANLYYFNFSKRDKKLIKSTKDQSGYFGDVYAVIYALESIIIFFKVSSFSREENAKITETKYQYLKK